MKTLELALTGIETTLWMRHLPFSSKDFSIGEEVFVRTEFGDLAAVVTGIADYGVTVRLLGKVRSLRDEG